MVEAEANETTVSGDNPKTSDDLKSLMLAREDFWTEKAKELWEQPKDMNAQFDSDTARATSDADVLAISETKKHFKDKRYHEMTDCLMQYMESWLSQIVVQPPSDDFGKLPPGADTFLHIILPIIDKLNEIRIVMLLDKVCQKLDPRDSLRLLVRCAKKLSSDSESIPVVASIMGLSWSRVGNYVAAEEILEAVEKQLDETIGVDVSTRSIFHLAFARFYQMTDKPSQFFKHCILHLSYTSLESKSNEERRSLAFDIAVASIIAEDVYSFFDLAQHPIIKSLEGTSDEWLLTLLYTFKDGNLSKFNELMDTSAKNQKDLVKHRDALREKIILLSFLDLCFRSPKQRLAFACIAEHCNISVDQVEIVVMESITRGLVRGRINQIEQVVSVMWVKPRMLDAPRLKVMAGVLDTWAESAKSYLAELRKHTAALAVSSD